MFTILSGKKYDILQAEFFLKNIQEVACNLYQIIMPE